MAESRRIAEIRRRVEADPASTAFAALGEEYRRLGRYEESIDTCRAGLVRHPGFLSARVTLGRALLELGAIDPAQAEFEHVLGVAPANLTAIRGLAEIHHHRGQLTQALARYREALESAPNDPDLKDVVRQIEYALEAETADPSEELSAATAARGSGDSQP